MNDFNADDVAQEVTDAVIYTIKNTPELYDQVKKASKIRGECVAWAKDHGDMFGDMFVGELEMAKWDEVKASL